MTGKRKPNEPLASGEENENPRGIGFLSLLAEDFRTHGRDPFSAGFWAIAVHRFGNWRMAVRSKPMRAPLTLLYKTGYRAVIARWGIDLPYNVKIGRRIRFAHHGCIHLGALEIGDDVIIRHSATIGLKVARERTKTPTIGNRVEIGPGACIVGEITVGDDTYVGPNTVLASSTAPGTTVIGVPSRATSLEELTKGELKAPVPVGKRAG